MNIKNAKYQLTAVNPDQYPAGDFPEAALVGRSNVGKSSFINVILGQKNLAWVAATPGKTRAIHFFNVAQKFYFVDLPGYGYARVSKAEKVLWQEMIEGYLLNRKQLQLILMLIDIRHAPSEDDRLMYNWIVQQDRPRLLVASKTDKIPRNQINSRLEEIRSILGMGESEALIPFSAISGQGREEIWNRIAKLMT